MFNYLVPKQQQNTAGIDRPQIPVFWLELMPSWNFPSFSKTVLKKMQNGYLVYWYEKCVINVWWAGIENMKKNCWISAASPVKQIDLELVELFSFSRPHSRSVAPSAVASAAQSGHLHMMLGGTVSWTFLFGAFVRHWLASACCIYPISGGERTFKEVVGWSLYIHRIKVNTKLTLWQVETSGAWMSKNGNILERSSILHLGFSVCAFISPHVIQV